MDDFTEMAMDERLKAMTDEQLEQELQGARQLAAKTRGHFTPAFRVWLDHAKDVAREQRQRRQNRFGR